APHRGRRSDLCRISEGTAPAHRAPPLAAARGAGCAKRFHAVAADHQPSVAASLRRDSRRVFLCNARERRDAVILQRELDPLSHDGSGASEHPEQIQRPHKTDAAPPPEFRNHRNSRPDKWLCRTSIKLKKSSDAYTGGCALAARAEDWNVASGERWQARGSDIHLRRARRAGHGE